jgi:hypothetical protein
MPFANPKDEEEVSNGEEEDAALCVTPLWLAAAAAAADAALVAPEDDDEDEEDDEEEEEETPKSNAAKRACGPSGSLVTKRAVVSSCRCARRVAESITGTLPLMLPACVLLVMLLMMRVLGMVVLHRQSTPRDTARSAGNNRQHTANRWDRQAAARQDNEKRNKHTKQSVNAPALHAPSSPLLSCPVVFLVVVVVSYHAACCSL